MTLAQAVAEDVPVKAGPLPSAKQQPVSNGKVVLEVGYLIGVTLPNLPKRDKGGQLCNKQ